MGVVRGWCLVVVRAVSDTAKAPPEGQGLVCGRVRAGVRTGLAGVRALGAYGLEGVRTAVGGVRDRSEVYGAGAGAGAGAGVYGTGVPRQPMRSETRRTQR
ncbi:hypothetical protein [Streptomyces sp. CB00316]|uniref:hypothetical protein n=1 Tax=Streptomyces sp. CB00316 TaxID=1703932 RepID=UPI001160F77E|nr:hypothetical protein [Streptomyces sp. CB00316]